MDICREVMDTIGLLKTEDIIDDNEMKTLLNECRHALTDNTEATTVGGGHHSGDNVSQQKAELKILKLAICSLVIELCKHNSPADAMKAVLEENGLREPKQYADGNGFNPNYCRLIEFYRSVRPQVRRTLTNQLLAEPLPSVVDTQWDQFYVLQSSAADKVKEIQYTISINCDRNVVVTGDGTGGVGDDDIVVADHRLLMTASLPHLQDLCHKLRDCRRSIEKIIKQ